MEDQSHRAKGKRTKRQRLQLSPSNSISEADGEEENFGQHQRMIINGEDYFSLTSNSNDHHNYDGSDESKEDEDLANCLILLAQGQSWNNSSKQGYELPSSSSSFKFNSRRFMEAADNGKAGCYVYECKTCNRSFPSFQALGGHRASHKKPLKAAAMELVNEKQLIISQLSPNIEPQEKEEEFKNNNSNPIELSFSRTKFSYKKLDFKVHECSICGAEFMSGQALGGHMRRHRRGLTSNGRASSVTAMAMAMEDGEEIQVKKQRSLLSLDLDLNLPAAPEDDHREQQTIVFSTPSLVGCHY